ncbi:MAG: 2-hydroxychromene-2-carboxylate isomerase [Rhodospirillales bacterium]
MNDILYFYSVRSSFAYLGSLEITALARQCERRLVHKPVHLGRLAEGSGGIRFPDLHPMRQAHAEREVVRWAKRRGMPVNPDPVHHYGGRELASGCVIGAQRSGGDVDALSAAVLAALWRDDRDLDSPEVLADLCESVGLDGASLVGNAHNPELQQEFAANSEEALALGVFGSPTYVVDGELFYGQDRLDFVREALARR